ncbi:hypothetical protein HDE_01965 [Halotydeus destructor]|nr:hypothetical protein HDE_01965 [Halotydeus destructor]
MSDRKEKSGSPEVKKDEKRPSKSNKVVQSTISSAIKSQVTNATSKAMQSTNKSDVKVKPEVKKPPGKATSPEVVPKVRPEKEKSKQSTNKQSAPNLMSNDISDEEMTRKLFRNATSPLPVGRFQLADDEDKDLEVKAMGTGPFENGKAMKKGNPSGSSSKNKEQLNEKRKQT